MEFSELPLHGQVLEGTKAAHFSQCMPVQERVLPISIDGSDVMVQSKTGSGKTAVYIITFLERFLRLRDEGKSASCLIVAPTRELAQQISDDAFVLCSKVEGFHVGCFYGGVGYEHQRKLLEMGCDIYVGTPGRLLEFMEHRELDCRRIDTFVIDEADRMFDMGFYPDIKKMFRLLPPREKRQTMLFSATLEMRVRELAWEFMNDPVEIELEPDHITVENITQELYHVAKSEKFLLFLQILSLEKPESAIVFTNSRHMASEVASRLKLNGYNADYLTGDLPQSQRQAALNRLKEGRTSILVATDVAARGLQIDDLPLVVNYDIPEDYENYVHRIGRTARAGKSGKAITFADEEFVYGLEPIEKYIKMKIPVVWPENLPDIEDKSLGRSWNLDGRSQRGESGRRDGRSGDRRGPHRSGERMAGGSKADGSRTDGRRGSSKGSEVRGQRLSDRASGAKDSDRADGLAKTSDGRGGGAKDPASRRPSGSASSQRPGKAERGTDYRSLGSMTEEERLAYYRQKYGFEPKGDGERKQKGSTSEKTSEKRPAKQSVKNPVKQKRPSEQPQGTKPSQPKADGPKAMEGKAQTSSTVREQSARNAEAHNADAKVADAQKPKKVGFLQRLFGKRNGGSK